ncbi:MAG: hypothetical protein E6Q98_25105 [Rhodospirillaceae bacterium]|nr:MAG: hypothetical protein E6Q98_25105 [Rhodospirillaceae bacterium]
MQRLGFLGIGVLAEAVIRGLQQAESQHARGGRYQFHLSPRSEDRSRKLADAYVNVHREDSNEAVVVASDVVFLAIRPQQIDLLAGLPFRREQTIVTFLAGTPLARIRDLLPADTRLARVIPLPGIRYRRGPIVMTPAEPVVEDLFGQLGDLIVVDKESDLAATGVVSGLMSSHFQLQNTAAAWLEKSGLPPHQAALYVRSMFAGLGEIGLAAAHAGEEIDPRDYETPGGLNECGRAFFKDRHWFDQSTAALDAIDAHSRKLSKP